MKTNVKHAAAFAMAVLSLVMGVLAPLRHAEAATTYNNTSSADLICSVNSSGLLQASLSVTGYKSKTTHISVELYVEKRVLGIFWKKVDIGCINNIWTDSTSNYYYSHLFSHSLSSTGTYRVTVTYTISGTGGADDVIQLRDTVTY